MQEAPEELRAAASLSLFSLSRAAGVALLSAAPKAKLKPLSNTAPGRRSARVSARIFRALSAALSSRGAGRANALQAILARPESLLELRAFAALPALLSALDEAPIADAVEEVLRVVLQLPALEQGFGGNARDFFSPISFEAEGDPQEKLQEFVASLEASLSGKAGDLRRLCLIREAAPARGQALARRLLGEKKLRPAVRAMALTALADDPEALSLLVSASRKGPQLVRRAATYALCARPEPEVLAALLDAASSGDLGIERAAFLGLAERSEPEAEAEVLAQIGKEGPPPVFRQHDPLSFNRLRQAFFRLRQPGPQARLREGAQDASIPQEDEGRRRWSRSHWVAALSMCPPSEENLSALCRACAAGGAPMQAFWQLARLDPGRAAALIDHRVRNTACEPERRRGLGYMRDGEWAYSLEVDWRGRFLHRQVLSLPEPDLECLMLLGWEGDFLRRLALQLGPEAFFEALHAEWREDEALRHLMQVNLQVAGQIWDPRWMQLMLTERAGVEVAGLVEAGAPKAAEQVILEAFPGAQAEARAALLSGLSRLHEGDHSAILELVKAQLRPPEGGAPLKGKLLYRRKKTLEALLSLLGAEDVQALAGLCEVAPAGPLATAVGARLAQLRGL